MTSFGFKERGFRTPTSPTSLDSILEIIKNTDVDATVEIDLRGCVFSYPFAKILEEVITKLNQLPHSDSKCIKLLHGYSIATENHLLPYLIKKNRYSEPSIKTIADFIALLQENHSIELSIEGPHNGK